MNVKHLWRKSTPKNGRTRPDYCERCGVDRSPSKEKEGCRPTRIF